jgi:mevalonate pyrophosphate decarboxylase
MPTHNTRHLSERESMTELASVLKRHEDELAKVQEEYSAKWDVGKRMQALKDGDALPGNPPKFPIKDQDDMNNAAGLSGSSSVAKATIVAHLKKMAKKHSLKLPASLQSS